VTGTTTDVRATEQSFLAANVLIENLGAPAPKGIFISSWMLKSHLISPNHLSVIAQRYPWISASGRFNPMSPQLAHLLTAAQLAVISQYFGGQAKSDTTLELRQIVANEIGSHPNISAPGGASIVKWLRVNVIGNVAYLEADVNVWESTPNLVRIGAKAILEPNLNSNQVDSLATLRRVGSRWHITSFNQAPWQQAT
jgi:hypothetical protein